MSFDLQPTLENEWVHLSPLTRGDYDALFQVAADPAIWEQHPVKNRSTEAGFNRFFAEALASGGTLVVREKSQGLVIGSSRFRLLDKAPQAVEIGWSFLARAYWGGQYNRAVKHLMLKHALSQKPEVVFFIDPLNIRSQKAVMKIGGKQLSQEMADAYLEAGRKDLVFLIDDIS
ncbi:MAG: GNAT family N-acetyltransferase [Bacteroidota bacterium]